MLEIVIPIVCNFLAIFAVSVLVMVIILTFFVFIVVEKERRNPEDDAQ